MDKDLQYYISKYMQSLILADVSSSISDWETE